MENRQNNLTSPDEAGRYPAETSKGVAGNRKQKKTPAARREKGGNTMNSKEEAMREEAREAIIEALRDGYAGYYSDLHHEIFNTRYYIIGTVQAKQALSEYGVFDAIGKVQEYEKNNFGEIHTDLSNPEKLINMLYYIIGEEVLYEMMDSSETLERKWMWNKKADEETNAEILEELGETI